MQKTKVIYIYGAPAVGKLTTATALASLTNYKVFHNHLTSDLVRSIFERGNPVGDMHIVQLRFEMLELGVTANVKGIIMTGVHDHNFIYPNGENDDWYATQLEKITNENGGEFYGIQLVATEEKLFNRVIQEDRKGWKKIHSVEVLREVMQKSDYTKSAPLKMNITIDNTDSSPLAVAKQIMEFVITK